MPTRIQFGVGEAENLPQYLHEMGVKRLLLVTDPGVLKAGLISPMVEHLQQSGILLEVFDQVAQNPRDTDCLQGARAFKAFAATAVLAIGGGSAIDTAKTIALLAKSGGTASEYADGLLPYHAIAPIVCLPTTAGTGSEVTRSAVITESSTHRKMTLKHANMRPALAVLDPLLTLSVPRAVTAATGVDALVHAIEGYTCTVTNPLSQAYGAQAMSTIIQALPPAVQDGQDLEARTQMLEGSLLAGLSFGNADVAAVHCLAEALGSMYDTPHGVANAIFLPHVLRFNAEGHAALHAKLARIMHFASDADRDDVAVQKMIEGIFAYTQELRIPLLRDLPNVAPKDFDHLVELAYANGSTPSNVRKISKTDYRTILETTFAYKG
jgi:alcohol dehydrogenase